MSWIEKINSDFTIKTGDGSTFTPNWLNANKTIDYNVSIFEFKELEGSLVKRRTPKGARYAFEIYFQGDNHLDIAKDFETAAANPKAWNVTHPFYGSILVQPIGMTFDNSVYNVTKINGEWFETITEDAPKVTLSPKDKILEDKQLADDALANTYASEVKAKGADIREGKSNATELYNKGKKTITDSIDAEDYFNAFNEAIAAFDNATADPLAAIRKLQRMVNKPFEFITTIQNRINLLFEQLTGLAAPILGSRNSKKLYENTAGTIVGAMTAASVTNATYSNRVQAISVVENIIAGYEDYLFNLDSISSLNGGKVDSYIANSDAIIKLSDLVSYTISVLLQIAADSRQERTLYLPEDTTLIQLAFELYGLTSEDAEINEIIDTNEIGISEMLLLQKGRKIVYYI